MLLIASILLTATPTNALSITGSEGERQIITPGVLRNEIFPGWTRTGWERESITFGFTGYGEMVTDQDPYQSGSDYGVGLTYPRDGAYSSEHIATPAVSGPNLIYTPIEGWQLYWKFKEGTSAHAIDPYWHVSMAVYGNHSSPYTDRARVDVEPVDVTVLTDTSRLFIAEVVVHTNNETLQMAFGFEPKLFEITILYVFFKNTKKIISYWTIEYLKTEYGPVDVVFRRMTDFDIDQKFQQGETECFAVFFPSSLNETAKAGYHAFWTGCDYWPQNYSLAVVWTNASIEHWVPPEGQSTAPKHHVGFVAYYPNCSNWDTDNWNHYTYNLLRSTQPARLFFGEGLGRRFQGQPTSVEYRSIGPTNYTGANLLMGQWNFTLFSTTERRKAQFVTVYGITKCPDTFGYVGDKYSDDWDKYSGNGHRTISEIKYLLSEVFNATYKLSSEYVDGNGNSLDLSNWYPFSGWHNHMISWDPRNTTLILGDSTTHYGSWCTIGPANTIDCIAATEIGESFGSVIQTTDKDPLWCAFLDTKAFKLLGTQPYYRNARGLTAWHKPFNGSLPTPTSCRWYLNHTINIGGPRVNLGTEYFNEHTWAVWISSASGTELPEAIEGGIFSIPSRNFYAATSAGGYSVITITDDLNLIRYTIRTGADSSTIVEPNAGLCVWGVSGWDTRDACYWLAHYWCNFNTLFTNVTASKRGVTTIILYTPYIAKSASLGWDYPIQEIIGPVTSRWRLSTTAWNTWVSIQCSIDWAE